MSVLKHLHRSRWRERLNPPRFSVCAAAHELRSGERTRVVRQAGAIQANCMTMTDTEDRVEVWLANGKRYCGQIVDSWPGHASPHGSLVLCEDDQIYVLIHRVHVTRIQRLGPASTLSVTPPLA